MANNPTVVIGSLNDEELKKSIDKLVNHVDQQLNYMVSSTKVAVMSMNKSLKSLGDTKIDFGGSADGGASKRAKAQNAETDAVEKNVAARDKQIKKNQETVMSFDQIAAALDKARQTVRDFNIGRQGGLPSADDYKRYKQALARIVEYNDKLKQSALGMAFSNEKAFSFDAKRNIKDMFAVDDRLKQLNKYYAEQEKLYQKATQDEERQRQKRVAAMEKESAEQKKIIDDQYKLSFARTMKIPTDQLDLAQAKLERLQALLRDMRERGILNNTQIASTEAEIRKLEQIIGQANTAQQQTTQSAQRYTEEIRKQAAAIRETQTWKEKGYAIVGGDSYYDPESSKASQKDVLSLEEQILKKTQQREEAEKKVSNVLKEEVETLNVAKNGFKIDNSSKEGQGVKSIGAHKQAAEAAAKETNYLKEQVASLLEVEEREIKTANATSSSYAQLAQYLKHLQSAYQRLGADRIAKGEGVDIADEIQRTQRAMQKLQKTMSRPISFAAAMKGDEKTLDDIAYKMQRLRSYRQGIDLTKPNAANEIRQVDEALAKLQKDADKWMSKSQEMIKNNTALGRSWNYMKNRLAFYFTVGAGTSFVKQLIDIRSQYELLERSIGILFDSMQTGSKIFSELNQMAIKSPFTTMELGSAAKQLSAYNIAAKDVVDTTRRLADMAAAVGIPIERLTYALGQIKSYGYLNSRDARMFANAGIPLIQNLADMYTKLEGRLVSIGDVYDRIKKKQVSFEDTLKVVHEMTDEGGRFFNFQEKAADTLKVRLANLTLAWNNMLNNMGKSNQGVLTSGLGVLKEMFENWRKIENLVLAIATNLGAVKAVQLFLLLNAKGITKQMALQEVLGKRLGTMIYGIAQNLKMLAVNPMTWLTIAITAATYLSWKFWDLTTANENFNKSIADGTKENIASIDKFFDKYRKDIESVGSMNTTDQEKMWERIREEIEKTTKNAQQYIDILEKIPELDKRVGKASGFLEQEKVIQEELNRLAQHGYFNIGGGFADDSYAEALTTIDKYTGEMIRKYGTYEDYIKAFKNEFQGFYDEFRDAKFSWNINEEIDESVKHFKKLENLNWDRILSGGTDEEKLARIRDTFMSLRDNFFATEEMQNAGAEAQALYNRHMDYWITSIAKANGLIKELTVNGKTYSAEDVAAVEERRTEWELFFSYLSDEERKTMDYLVKTNQTGGEEFKKIWDTVADSMKKSNATAYRDLQKKIAELRETPDIVINVVYREMRDKLDEQQQAFENRWIRPENWSVRNLSAEDYLKEETANRTKYGRLMRKTEEDNVEWEERLGKEYQENEKKIKSLNAQLQNKNNLSEADRKQKEKDLNLYKDLNKAIEDIGKAENFNYDQFKKGGKGSKKDPMLDTLKQTIEIVKKLQSEYDTLTRSGDSSANALEDVRSRYSRTINLLNKDLQTFGLPQLNIDIIKGRNPNEILKYFQQISDILTNKGLSTLERQKAVEVVIQEFSLKAKTYNLDMITKGLNSELDRLKEEYELAIALDADPELGSIFADWMGIDMDNLPRTAEEYAKRATNALNKALKERDADLELPNLLNITDDDLRELQNRVGTGGITQTYVDEITKAVKDVRGVFKKEKEDTSKEWNALIEKYGGLQAKILQIYKKNVQQQASIVKQFGNNEQISKALDLVRKIQISQDPAEIARLQEELANVLNDVTKNNPIALKTYQATQNEQKSDESKAYWEDFKESDLYTMTFEDMSRNSTRAIQLIIDKLNELKFKVKEDPASMKALTKSLEEANKEFESRSSTTTIVNGIKEYIAATKEVTVAKQKLKEANTAVEGSEIALKNANSVGDANAIADATERLQRAREKQKEATERAAQAENKLKAAQEKIKAGLNVLSAELQNIEQLLGAVSSLFAAAGDEETAEAINEISKGFSVMTTVIMGVIAALILLEATNPWLLAIAAALSVIVGLVSFLSGNSNKKITEQVEESERAVKKLENSYKRLEYAAEQAFGAATSGAQQALKANKELQLYELRRQLALEQSRTGKHYDEDKVLDLKGQIIDLENEIKDFTKSAVNDLLGISSHGDFFEDMISEMIDAFKSGEDAMKVFEEKWSKMIDNMIMKTIVSQVLQNWVNSLEKGANDILDKYTNEQSNAIANLNNKMTEFSLEDAKDAAQWVAVNDKKEYKNILDQLKKEGLLTGTNPLEDAILINYSDKFQKRIKDAYIANMQSQLDNLNAQLDKASLDATGELIDYYGRAGEDFKANYLDVILDKIKENWNFGQDSENKLSQLQQGIQSVSETTASALEAYMNSVNQQVYLHSELLTQIRDAIVGADSDIQLGVQGQILLQLQTSYQTQQAIQSILEGWSSPNGMSVRVEMV